MDLFSTTEMFMLIEAWLKFASFGINYMGIYQNPMTGQMHIGPRQNHC